MKKVLIGFLGVLLVVNVGAGLLALVRVLLNANSTITMYLGFNLAVVVLVSCGILIVHAIRHMHKTESPSVTNRRVK